MQSKQHLDQSYESFISKSGSKDFSQATSVIMGCIFSILDLHRITYYPDVELVDMFYMTVLDVPND